LNRGPKTKEGTRALFQCFITMKRHFWGVPTSKTVENQNT
jgi:hypothetical protein